MKTKKRLLHHSNYAFILLLSFFSFSIPSLIPSLSLASLFGSTKEGVDISEEISYDELVQTLSKKRNQWMVTDQKSPLDELQIHGSISWVSSFSQFRIQERNHTQMLHGMQLGVGIELIHNLWSSEFLLRNYGVQETPSLVTQNREWGVKIYYQNRSTRPWAYNLGIGYVTHYLKWTDKINSIEVNESSPSMLFFVGLNWEVHSHFLLGIETGLRAPFLDNRTDQLALDSLIKIETFF